KTMMGNQSREARTDTDSWAERAAAGARLLARRLDWREPGDPAGAGEDRTTMARTFAYLFGLGATLLLLTLAFDHAGDRNAGGLVATAVAAYLAAAWFLIAFERIPLWAFRASPAA